MARRASAASQLGPVVDGKRTRRQDPGAAAGLANSLSQAERARGSVSRDRSRSRSADQDEEAMQLTQRAQSQSSAFTSLFAGVSSPEESLGTPQSPGSHQSAGPSPAPSQSLPRALSGSLPQQPLGRARSGQLATQPPARGNSGALRGSSSGARLFCPLASSCEPRCLYSVSASHGQNMCSHINSAHVVMFEDVAVRRVAVNEVLHGVQNSRFCDVCAKFYMDTNYGRTWRATGAAESPSS